MGFEIKRTKPNTPVAAKGMVQEVEPEFFSIVEETQATGIVHPSAKLYATYKAMRYIVDNNIPGDIVECGVLMGRHGVIAGATLKRLKATDRRIFLYDTFAGMTAPTEHDFKAGRKETFEDSKAKFEQLQSGDHNKWCYGPLDQVKKNVFSTGYPKDQFHFVVGSVLDTLPNKNHTAISFLRLDTDFYDSTKHELEHLYSLVSPGGVVTIDDYGSWAGSKKATDEFLAKLPFRPLLVRTDDSQRVFTKPF